MLHSYVKSFFFALALFLAVAEQSYAQQPQLDLNKATAEQLAEALTGISETKAKLIVMYRKEHGGFKSVEEIVLVKGIGVKTLEKNRHLLKVEKTSAGQSS